MGSMKHEDHKHLMCVVCAYSFDSVFDEELRIHPIFHPQTYGRKKFQCEYRFYEALLRCYQFIHQCGTSVPLNQLMQQRYMIDFISLRKEMMMWCHKRGFIALDGLKRIIIPKPIEPVAMEIFAEYNLTNDRARREAVEVLKAALRCLRDELAQMKSEEDEQNIEEQLDGSELGASTLASGDATSRMATATLRGESIRVRR